VVPASVFLAELEVFHSRPIAPTRRVALGRMDLPVTPAPGFGGILLGGIVAANMSGLDPDLFDDLDRLTHQLQDGQRIPQPRLRHRFQTDRIGLTRSVHRLIGHGEDLEFDVEEKAHPAQSVLAAVYAAGRLDRHPRGPVMDAIRKAMRWSGAIDRMLVAHLSGLDRGRAWDLHAFGDPVSWALDVLGLDLDETAPERRPVPERTAILRRFRDLLRDAHPDHGGATDEAAQRIADLTEARRILLAG
jgi:hypothetical protein